MDYTIDNPDQIIDHWLHMFEALSVKQFEKFSDLLEFPIQFSDDIQKIAKDFSLAVQSYLGKSIPGYALAPRSVEPTEIDPLIQIWTDTFSQLKLSGYADAVYLWGQKLNQIKQWENNLPNVMSDWDILLIDWAHDSTSNKLPILDLPFKTGAKLQLLITQYEQLALNQRFEIGKMKDEVKESWEKYAFKNLGVAAWISNTARYFIQLSKWKAIISFLSAQELEILDAWGSGIFSNVDVENHFSLIQFARELRPKTN